MASGGATILSMVRAPAKFGVGDAVQFIGTDTPYTVKEYNPETLEYRVQCGDEPANSQWASEIYLELLESALPKRAVLTRLS
jgi:hypothetical protein